MSKNTLAKKTPKYLNALKGNKNTKVPLTFYVVHLESEQQILSPLPAFASKESQQHLHSSHQPLPWVSKESQAHRS